jgi:S1-C subfamily serine protease
VYPVEKKKGIMMDKHRVSDRWFWIIMLIPALLLLVASPAVAVEGQGLLDLSTAIFKLAKENGIISARHRRGITNPCSCRDFVQTDADINPGNSAEPLLNLRGEAIGVNVVNVSKHGAFEGIGFAIPSNMAVHIAEKMVRQGKVAQGWLGLKVQDLTTATKSIDLSLRDRLGVELREVTIKEAQKYNLKTGRGVAVAGLVPNGPLGKTGFEVGDIILEINGRPVRGVKDFVDVVISIGSDEWVTLLALDHRTGRRGYVQLAVE